MNATLKGRGTALNMPGRFERLTRGTQPEHRSHRPPTRVFGDRSRTIIATNDSPDIGFDRSINTYRGCEHGCIYCYARPTHAYLGLSPGLDFETQIFAKHDAAARLRAELGRKGYRPAPLQLSGVTDCYQPVERDLQLTRAVLEVLLDWRHPVRIVTKSARVLRDLDLLQALAALDLVQVELSLTTLDSSLARAMEPRASRPARRLDAIAGLAAHGVPVGVMTSPVIPGLNCHELERLLEAAAGAGAGTANYVLLRLPHELRELFDDWLRQHHPHRRQRVQSLLRQMRGGRLNDPRFTSRMRGEGPLAELISQRFKAACRRYGLTQRELRPLRTDLFGAPEHGWQSDLFVNVGAETPENG